ncbi:MAG: hypothetical protein IT214_13205 [Chitinophagaceae bacterium]|nr:hypothetical protein [Chitinophagaceae bacterium]
MKNNRRDFFKTIGFMGLFYNIHNDIGKGFLDSKAYKKDKRQFREWSDNINTILENTTPLKYSRGERLPLYLWPAIDPGDLDIEEAKQLVELLDKRGVGIICSWRWDENQRLNSLNSALSIARAQKELNQHVNIDATSLLNSFFDGNEKTAHIDKNGNPFFDYSFGKDHKIGCPFTLDYRKEFIRERVESFVKKYKEEGIDVDFIYTDWEIDGPLSVNGSYKASQRCKRCVEYLGKNFSYDKFQRVIMDMRAYLQYYSYSYPVLSQFPGSLIGNYGDYPNDGYRYWYDYYEKHESWQPYKQEQNAKYRKWHNNFSRTGFTMAMPVVYTWDNIYKWYKFSNTDYRWFYNMLRVASNSLKNVTAGIPVVSFVHWNTIFIGEDRQNTEIRQMSEGSYRELLWHMLLRGNNSFFMWSEKKDFSIEVKLVHEVYSAALQYREFLEYGWPVNFDVPEEEEAIIISGLALNDKILVRRTDFGSEKKPVKILVGTKPVMVNYNPGICQVVNLN